MTRDAAPAEAAKSPAESAARRAEPGVLRSLLRRCFAVGFLSATIAGLILRMTVRDRIPLLAVAFYVLQPAVLAATAWLSAAMLRPGWMRRIAAVMALGCTIAWGVAGWSFRGAEPSPGGVRVAFWNVVRGALGWDAVVEQVKQFDADIIGLVETDRLENPKQVWKEAFSDRSVAVLPEGLTLIVRGDLGSVRSLPLHPRCAASAVDVSIDGTRLNVVLVDIYSGPLLPRRKPLARLAQLAPRDGTPTIVMGDFNTPPDSAWLDPLRKRFRNTFEEAGGGYRSTWPLPLRVLTLDQIWVDDGLTVEQCRHGWTARSDHRPVTCAVRVKGNP